jgi:hypothetical protein
MEDSFPASEPIIKVETNEELFVPVCKDDFIDPKKIEVIEVEINSLEFAEFIDELRLVRGLMIEVSHSEDDKFENYQLLTRNQDDRLENASKTELGLEEETDFEDDFDPVNSADLYVNDDYNSDYGFNEPVEIDFPSFWPDVEVTEEQIQDAKRNKVKMCLLKLDSAILDKFLNATRKATRSRHLSGLIDAQEKAENTKGIEKPVELDDGRFM